LPDRPFVYARGLQARLDDPPPWLEEFAAYASARFCPGRALQLLHGLRRLLTRGIRSPRALLEAARLPGRSMGALARTLEGFFVEAGLALPLDQADRLARGRRHRRINAVPQPFRAAVAAFAQAQLESRSRRYRAGIRPEADATIEQRLAGLRDFTRYLIDTRPWVTGWELIGREDVEGFIGTSEARKAKRLAILRVFFRWARSHRLVLVDPTRRLSARSAKGFKSEVVEPARQRALLGRWTTEQVHPHEAFVGLAALLHGASSSELRHLTLGDVDERARTIRLGRRPMPVPLDPATWAALEACLAHRENLRTINPHVIVTKITATGERPASTAYVAHVLDPAAATPKHLRWTRLARLVHSMDPKLVADAFGLTTEASIHYLLDSVDEARLQNM
jgi:integrase